MKEPSRALNTYMTELREESSWPWLWRVLVRTLRRERWEWAAPHLICASIAWPAASEARRSLAIRVGTLGMPPLPPSCVEPNRRVGWACQRRAQRLVEAGAELRASAEAANRLRRAMVALDMCSSRPTPPNLDALPLDRVATARGFELDTVRQALEAASRALPSSAQNASVYARIVAFAAHEVDRFAVGDDDSLQRLDAAIMGINEARLWLEARTACGPDKIPRTKDARRLSSIRDHLELATAAAYKAQIALLEGDAKAVRSSELDAKGHAEAALSMVADKQGDAQSLMSQARPNRWTHADKGVIEVKEPTASPLIDAPAPPEAGVFADRACGLSPTPFSYVAPDHSAVDRARARNVVTELQRALKARSTPDRDADPIDGEGDLGVESAVVVEPPTTRDITSEPRFAAVAACISSRLTRTIDKPAPRHLTTMAGK